MGSPSCRAGLGRLGDCGQVTLEMKTQLSARQMLLRWEEPLGGFAVKWRLFPWEKSASNFRVLMGLRKESVPTGRCWGGFSVSGSKVELQAKNKAPQEQSGHKGCIAWLADQAKSWEDVRAKPKDHPSLGDEHGILNGILNQKDRLGELTPLLIC